MTKNHLKVYKLVARIPRGKVLTYGAIGKYLDLNPRVVGNILHQNPDPKNVPCHRVVNAKGGLAPSFAFGGEEKQRELLENEGVIFIKNRVNLEKYLWEII